MIQLLVSRFGKYCPGVAKVAHQGVCFLFVVAAWISSPRLVGAGLPLDADEYLVRRFGVEEGFPDESATAVAQAPDGYLWIGTFNGLVRFNGVDTVVQNPANTPELPSASIVNLHIDKAGRLFASTFGGLVVREGTPTQYCPGL